MKLKFILFTVLLLSSTYIGCKKSGAETVDTNGRIDFENNSDQYPDRVVLQNILDKYKKQGMPGLSMLVYTNKGTWIGTAGYSSIENKTPLQLWNVFHSASVIKTYMAVATLKLAEHGKLQLNDKIDKYLPSAYADKIANGHEATVLNLLNHTSGIPDFLFDSKHETDYYNNFYAKFSTEDYLKYIFNKKAVFTVGEKYEYCNTNYLLLALVLDRVAGNHANVLTELLFKPYGLAHTYYKNEAGYPAPFGAVNTYVDLYGDGAIQNSTGWERNFAKNNIGHDGMLFTTHDCFLFYKALFIDKSILNSNSLKLMSEYKFERDPIQGYRFEGGLGTQKITSPNGLQRIYHAGTSLGAANWACYYPEKNAIIVINGNFGGIIDSPIADTFLGVRGRGKTPGMLEEVESVVFP